MNHESFGFSISKKKLYPETHSDPILHSETGMTHFEKVTRKCLFEFFLSFLAILNCFNKPIFFSLENVTDVKRPILKISGSGNSNE
jgi:hypothetical protein